MRLTVELHDGTGAGRPAVIEADDDVTVGAVAFELAAGLRLYDMASPSLRVVGRPAQQLAPNAHLALADIRSGDRVEVVEGDHTTSLVEQGAATVVIEAGPQAGRRIELLDWTRAGVRAIGSRCMDGAARQEDGAAP